MTDPAGAVSIYAYDAKGQLTSVTVPGVVGGGATTALYYDTSGNLIRTVSPSGLETVYGYDANGNRILERDAAGKTVTRLYDLATNLLTSETTYTVADPDGAGALQPSDPMIRRFFYDAGKLLRFAVSAEGRVTEYRYNALSDQWNPGGGYDAMGNLTGYTVVIPGTKRGSNGRYIIKYSLFDSYKEDSTTLATNNTTNISHYDVNGNRTSITKGVLETVLLDPGTVTENDGIMTVEGQRYEDRVRDLGEVVNRLWYDADGHIQSHTAGGQTEFNLIVNGQVYGEESQTADNILGSNYLGVTSASLAAAPSSYSVQSTNETLQGIAQSIWGDANLWYLIADANALGSDAKLTVGQVLRIPARVNTVHGDYGTYKPYDPSEQIGSTAPVMPEPKAGKGGCGGLGQIVMIVVAVVATIYTAGAAAGLMGVSGGAFSAGLSVMAGTATVGGVGIGAAASFGLAAVGGAVGSIASQAVGIATGVQDGFNWKGVALSALGAGVGAGVAAGASSLGNAFVGTGPAAQAARAALGSAISQKVAVATGLQDHFDWRSVAASAAGAAVGAKLGANKAFQNALSFSDVARSTMSGIVTGTVASVVRGGKVDMVNIATDAFGNALGNSIADRLQSRSRIEEARSATSGALQDFSQRGTDVIRDQLMQADPAMTLDEASAIANRPKVQRAVDIFAAMGSAQEAMGTRFEDMPLRDQQSYLDEALQQNGDSLVTNEMAAKPAALLDAGTVEIVGRGNGFNGFVRTGANVLDATQNAMADLIEAVGPGKAQAAAFGLQIAVGGIPRTALSYVGEELIGPAKSYLNDSLSGLIAQRAFGINDATPQQAVEINKVSHALGGFGIEAALGTAGSLVTGVLAYKYLRSTKSSALHYETPDHLLPDNIQGHGGIDFPVKPHWAANLGNRPSAAKWGQYNGTNQGVKHFAQYYDDFPDRIPSIEKRLGLESGKLAKTPEGFDTFT